MNQCHGAMTIAPAASPLVGFELSPYALSLRAGITLEQWGHGLHFLATVEHSVQWWVGDAWLLGDAVWGEDAAQHMHTFANGTIRNCAVVCRKFDTAWRNRYKAALDDGILRFEHFRRITSLKDDSKLRYWLDLAVANEWSAARLGAEIDGVVGGKVTIGLSAVDMSKNAEKLVAKLTPGKVRELIDELQKHIGE